MTWELLTCQSYPFAGEGHGANPRDLKYLWHVWNFWNDLE